MRASRSISLIKRGRSRASLPTVISFRGDSARNPFDLHRASTIAFQNNGTNPTSGSNILIQRDSIDANASFLSLSSASYETVLWMTLYPLNIGGRYDPGSRTAAWTIANTPSGRRYPLRAHRLSAAGLDLSRSENLEFWALVDTNATRRTANPTLIFDFGEISENRVAYAPESLYVRPGSRPDSLFRGEGCKGSTASTRSAIPSRVPSTRGQRQGTARRRGRHAGRRQRRRRHEDVSTFPSAPEQIARAARLSATRAPIARCATTGLTKRTSISTTSST
jgi:hypothetical protein